MKALFGCLTILYYRVLNKGTCWFDRADFAAGFNLVYDFGIFIIIFLVLIREKFFSQ